MADATFDPADFHRYKTENKLDDRTGFDPEEFNSFKDGTTHANDLSALQEAATGGGQLGLGQTLSLMGNGGPLETPWSKLSNAFPKMAGAGAEAIGRLDASPVARSITQHVIGLNPSDVGAAAMLPVSMTPNIVSALGALNPATGAAGRAEDILRSGSRIGAAEDAANVLTKAAEKYPTSGNVGEVLNTLEDQLKGGSLAGDAQKLKETKDIIDFIHDNPRLVGKTDAITVQAARVSKMIQQQLNAAIPGRAGPAADYSTLMTLKNAASTAAKVGGGAAAAELALSQIRKLFHP